MPLCRLVSKAVSSTKNEHHPVFLGVTTASLSLPTPWQADLFRGHFDACRSEYNINIIIIMTLCLKMQWTPFASKPTLVISPPS
jgi:hypothetical protein